LSHPSCMLDLVKRLSKAVSCHLCGGDMRKLDLAIFDSVLNVVIVNINVLCALVMTLREDQVNSWLVVAKEVKRRDVCA
jgi:uncharacterized protein (DUF983 family)